MSIIEDGTGKGNVTKVDNTNRISSRSVTDTSIQEAFKDGRAFLFSSLPVTLTSANESYLMYLKNCCDRDMFVWLQLTDFGQSVNACCVILTGDYQSSFILCPTGCITTCGTVGTIPNLNLGSVLTATATGLRGAEGTAATGFANAGFFTGPSRLEVPDLLVIPKGKSFTVGITPPPGNVSMRGQVTVKFYFIDEV